MRKIFTTISLFLSLGFLSGCASNGMALNTLSNNRVDRTFIEGTIKNQTKVIIDNREVAALTGIGIGAVGGAVVSGNNRGKGAIVGGVVGGVAGALIGNEVEAFDTVIIGDNGQEYHGYLEQRLTNSTRIEFTVVDGKLKNVNVLTQSSRK